METSAIDARLRSLLGDERRIQAEFLVHLDEFDRRRGFEAHGCTSTWQYLRRELGILECAIQRRLAALSVIRVAPVAVGYVRDGRLCATGLALLKDVITENNCERMLEKCANKSRREIEYIVACASAPVPEPAPTLRRLPSPNAGPEFTSGGSVERPAEATRTGLDAERRGEIVGEGVEGAREDVENLSRELKVNKEARGRVTPIAEERFQLKLVVGSRFVEKLERVKAALSHLSPGGDLEVVLERALDSFLAAEDKKHAAPVRRSAKAARAHARVEPPENSANNAAADNAAADNAAADNAAADNAAEGNAAGGYAAADNTAAEKTAERDSEGRETRSRFIPKGIRAAVWARDGGKCAWALPGGGTCGSTHRVEFDHVIPFGKGGETTAENLRLLCGAHNAQHARESYGAQVVEAAIRRARGGKSGNHSREMFGVGSAR